VGLSLQQAVVAIRLLRSWAGRTSRSWTRRAGIAPANLWRDLETLGGLAGTERKVDSGPSSRSR